MERIPRRPLVLYTVYGLLSAIGAAFMNIRTVAASPPRTKHFADRLMIIISRSMRISMDGTVHADDPEIHVFFNALESNAGFKHVSGHWTCQYVPSSHALWEFKNQYKLEPDEIRCADRAIASIERGQIFDKTPEGNDLSFIVFEP